MEIGWIELEILAKIRSQSVFVIACREAQSIKSIDFFTPLTPTVVQANLALVKFAFGLVVLG